MRESSFIKSCHDKNGTLYSTLSGVISRVWHSLSLAPSRSHYLCYCQVVCSKLQSCIVYTLDPDEVDFSLEPPHRERLNSHLKPWQWPPATTVQEKKPDREVRVRLSITETDFVVVEDLTSAASNAVVLKVSCLPFASYIPTTSST